jgi:hypothetical protein
LSGSAIALWDPSVERTYSMRSAFAADEGDGVWLTKARAKRAAQLDANAYTYPSFAPTV